MHKCRVVQSRDPQNALTIPGRGDLKSPSVRVGPPQVVVLTRVLGQKEPREERPGAHECVGMEQGVLWWPRWCGGQRVTRGKDG